MTGTGIVIAGLSKTYRRGKVRALDGVSLAIRPGEVFGVIGPNGAGKTTLMGCLLGFLFPDEGTVTVDGLPPDDLAVRAVTGYLPERLMFDRWMTGRDFLAYHHALAGAPAADRSRDVASGLDRVGLDHDAGAKRVKEYSRGMLQRLGLAQALIGRPRYLLLDEPTSGMDPIGTSAVRALLADLPREGVTVIVNSHQLEQLERLCDRVAYVQAGRVTSVETLKAGADTERTLTVRAGAPGFSASLRKRLGALAERAGARLIEAREEDARFAVPDDRVAAKLLALLVRLRAPVVEAVPDRGRLERLFFEGRDGRA